MAWNSGNLTFTMSWKSLKWRTCLVRIYVRGSQIQTPLSLTAGAQPFTYDDDADSDLLNNVVRYKTGYLRVIETAQQDLSYLYPTDDFSHYVEFYYGGVLNFVGFLQAQDFDNGHDSYPREREFAVASPLWALSQKRFNFAGNVHVPHFVTLGSLLDEVMATGSIYESVIFPYFEDLKLDNTVWSGTFAPWNEEFNHVIQSMQQNNAYTPETFQWYLDALCKAFGWVLHDDITSLCFTMFDYKGRYAKYPVGHIGDPNYLDLLSGPEGGTATDLSTKLTYCDDGATESALMPYSNIKVEYEGEYEDTADLSYLRTYNFGYESVDDIIRAVGLQPLLTLSEISPQGTAISFDSARKVATQGVHVCVFNSQNSPSKQLGICYAIKGNENDGDVLFTIRHYTPFSSADWRVKCKVSSGSTLNDLSESDTTHRFGNIAHNVYRIGNGYVECDFIVRQVHNSEPMGIPANAWSVRDAIFFSDIEWYMEAEDSFDEYTTITRGYDDIVGTHTSFEEGQLSMPLHMYRKNDHMIGSSIRATKFTEYPYLLEVRNELQARFQLTATGGTPFPEHMWCTLWKYLTQSWRWRIIGYTFNPTDDELTLTMERSTTLQ